MDRCDSPWLFAAWAVFFAEDTILSQQKLIPNIVIIINPRAILAFRVNSLPAKSVLAGAKNMALVLFG
jgi:hypothetical protein